MSVISRITNLGIAFAFCSLLSPLYAQTTDAIDSLNHLVSVAKDPVSKVGALLDLASEIEGSDQKKALDYAQQAYLLSRQTGNKKGEINALIQKGNCYFRMSEFQDAMESAENALAMAEELKMDKEIALSLNVIGGIYNELGEYDNSSEHFFKSLSIFEKIHDKKGISQSLGFLGTVYDSQKEYTKALGYLNKSLSLAKSLGDRSLITKNLNNISIVYLHLLKYDISLMYINEALRINKQLNDKRKMGLNYINIGLTQIKQKKYDAAMRSFQEALKLSKETNNRVHIAICCINMGGCYYETGNKPASVDAYKKALSAAQLNGYMKVIYEASSVLGRLYLERKDTSNAFKYKILENQSKDSLGQLRTTRNLTELEFRYQTDKKELERKIVQQKKENLMEIAILALISGLIITILMLSRHRIKSKNIALEKQTLEKELSFKNQELSINLMSMMKKNEMLADISSRLIQIEKNAIKEETREAIVKISQELRKGADEKLWKEFSVRFQEVHNGFYETLLEKFPDLTQNELKMCAFLKLNMSTKDIAELTGQTQLSLEKSRYRLRKKLNITNSEINLVTFLLQF
jgi:tetratricopeptide (TPR) repeat protein